MSPETAELRIWMPLKEMRQTRKAGLLNVKEKGMTICYDQVFGNVFERRESKCCAVLMILLSV